MLIRLQCHRNISNAGVMTDTQQVLIDVATINSLISEIESLNLTEESKAALSQILKNYSKMITDAETSKLSIAKLKSILGFFSEKEKK